MFDFFVGDFNYFLLPWENGLISSNCNSFLTWFGWNQQLPQTWILWDLLWPPCENCWEQLVICSLFHEKQKMHGEIANQLVVAIIFNFDPSATWCKFQNSTYVFHIFVVQPPTSCCTKAPHQANISMVTNVQLIDSDCSCSSYDNALHIYISTSIRLIYTRTMNHVAMILSVRNHTLPETHKFTPENSSLEDEMHAISFWGPGAIFSVAN